MDLRDQACREFRIEMKNTGGYRFLSQASEGGRLHGGQFASDEPDPVGDASAPATPALLGAAVGHCLAASLLETAKHAHVDVQGCDVDVTSVVVANAAGLPRIDHVDVVIRPSLRGASPRTGRCEEVFEQHCTVTASVRQGIDVRVRVDWQNAPAASSGEYDATPVPPQGSPEVWPDG
jgi:uncharacterized OsmC-like protein